MSTSTTLTLVARLRGDHRGDQGGRPGRARRPRAAARGSPAIVAMMAPALFAALVVTQALADGRHWAVGADTVGVALSGIAAWRGASVIVGRGDRGGHDRAAAAAF